MAIYPEPQNMTGLEGIFKYANNVSDGIFGIGILISLWIIVFGYLSMRGEEGANAAMVAGYITTLTAIFLFLIGLITGLALFISIMTVVIPALWSYWQKS